MAIRFRDLTAQIDGIRTDFSVSPTVYDVGSTIPVFNGETLTRTVDYNEDPNRQTIHLLFTPGLSDKLVVYFDDPRISPVPSSFDVPTLKAGYLFGLDLKDQFGNVMPDTTLGQKLTIGVARMEREMRDFSMTPKVIKSNIVNGVRDAGGGWAIEPEPAAQSAADMFEPPYDYDVIDYLNWGFLPLRRKPVISVERVRLIYPTGQTIITYPPEWIKLFPKFGQIQIVPMAGSFKQYPLIGQGAMYLPLMSGFMTKNVPQLIHVDYTTGLESGKIPDDMKDATYKLAAVEVLKLAGQGKAPGVAALSTSADGLSESTTLTQSGQTQLYGAIIKQYEDDVKMFLVDFMEHQKGIEFRVA
jgi:hypothetical protein